MILGILALFISLGSLTLAILAYRQTLQMKKIEQYFKLSTPEEMDIKIKHVKQDLEEHLLKLEQRFRNTRIEAKRELAKRNITGSTATEMLLKIDMKEKEQINRAHKITNRKIELLEFKKRQIEEL